VRWLQVHTPPAPMLADRAAAGATPGAARRARASSLRLVLHAPDDLSAGTVEDDRAFAGLLDYAAEAGAELVAYHGLNFVDAGGPTARAPTSALASRKAPSTATSSGRTRLA
jgi:hypothetical protein